MKNLIIKKRIPSPENNNIVISHLHELSCAIITVNFYNSLTNLLGSYKILLDNFQTLWDFIFDARNILILHGSNTNIC